MPAFGGLTMRARWPLPIGLTRLISRWLRFFGSRLEVDQLVRVDRGQVAEDRPAAGGLGVDAVDRVDAEHAPVLLGLARRADGAGDAVADAQAEAADLAGADVDVVGAGQQAVAAHEAEALVDDVEDAGGVGVAGALGLALEDPVDEVVLALVGPVSSSRSRPTWRSSVTLISRRSETSRSFRSRAASSSCCSSYSVTGARPPPPTGFVGGDGGYGNGRAGLGRVRAYG